MPGKFTAVQTVILMLAVFWSATAAAQDVPRQSLVTDTGETFDVYVAGPEDAPIGIVLVHDWFGVSPYYLEVIERLSRSNRRIVAVDLYGGETATDHQTAWRLMSNLDADTANQKVSAAVRSLQRTGRQMATFGFSMGSVYALEASARHAELVTASVIFYGDTLQSIEKAQRLGGPVLAIYGSKDGNAADEAARFSNLMDDADVGAEIYIYPGAAHAFAQPLFNAGKTYDPVAANLAMQLAENFLSRRLKSGTPASDFM